MNIKLILPTKKALWKSASNTIELAIWLSIFGSLNLKDFHTYLIFIGLFVWTYTNHCIDKVVEDKPKKE